MTRATGKGGMSVERPVPLVVGVKTLKLSDDVLRTPGLGAVWVEVDVLGLSREQLRTTKLTPKPTVELNFEASIPVKSSGAEADALRRALEASTPQDSDVLFTAMAQGASGPTQLGVGFVNLKELYTAGRELPSATVTLRGSNERRVGSLDISLAALGALHRASAADTVRVCVGTISLPDDIVHDPSVAELWVEVDLSCCAVPTALRTKAVTNQPLTRRSAAEGGGSTTLDFGFTHQVATPAGSAALLALQKALATKEESDSDVYFVLKARGKGGGGKGEARPSGADRELAEGYLNLEAMLKQGTDHINLPLKLERKGGGVAATLQVSLIAVEPLRRIQFPVSSSDAIRIDVGELTASEALVGDGAIVDVWVEVDVLDLDGGTPLRTPPLRKTAPKLDFNFSQTLTVDGDKLETLRRALEGPEQESDVYFVLKGRGPRVPERELAQGFINLQHLAQSVAKGGSGDVVRTKISLISEERKSYGNLVVSLVASELLTRARQAQLGGSKDAIRLELGALELAPIVRADASVFELWVEIDFLGMGEPAPLATARVPKGASATLELEYKHTIAVPPGSRQQATLKTALVGKTAESADVYVTLKSAPRRGEERVVGQGAFNLRSDLLGKKLDLVGAPIALQGLKGPVGTLRMSVIALEALRAALPTTVLSSIEEESARLAEGAVASAVTPQMIRVEVGALNLAAALKSDPEVGEVWIEVDLVDIGDKAALVTPHLRKTAAPLDFKFSHSVSIAPGSREQETLKQALDAKDEQESDVYFELKTSVRGQESEVAQGFLNLKKLLADGQDVQNRAVALQGRKGPAGTLKVSLIALDALKALDGPVGVASAAASQIGPRLPATLTLEVGKLVLPTAVRQDLDVGDVFVVVDLLGLGGSQGAKTIETRKVHKMKSPLDFAFTRAIEVNPDSAEASTIKAALEAKEDQESDVYFELKYDAGGRGIKELGSGFLNLKKAHKDGADFEEVQLPLQGPAGDAGTLTVSIRAVDVIKAVLAPPLRGSARQEAMTRTKPAASGTGRQPIDTVRIDVGRLELAPTIRSDPSVGELFVQVDLLDLGSSGALKTARLPKGGSALDFKFSHSVSIAPGSREQETLKQALDAKDEQESDVYFELKTSVRGQESDVAQGFLNLKKLLDKGADLLNQRVQLSGRDGGNAGTLTCSIAAIQALRNAVSGPSGGRDVARQTSISVEVGALNLAAALKSDPEVGEVWIEVDLVDIGDKAALSTAHLSKRAVPLEFGFAYSVSIAPGSREQETLKQVLDAKDEQESDVYFELKTSVRGKDEQVAQGFLNLKKLLADGKDFANVAVALQGRKGPAGTLKVSLIALDALRWIQDPSDMGSAASSRGRATARGAAPAPAPPERPAVRVEVGALTMTPRLRDDINVDEMWVEIDMIDMGEKAALSTAHLKKLSARGKPLDFGFSHAIEVARGSRDANALKAALDNPSAQESDVYFILRSVDPKGKEFDVGQAYLNLRKLVDEQRDVVRAPTPLLDPRGQSLGQLTLSIFALDAIREATGEARRAGVSAGTSDAKSPSKSASKFASSLEPSATSPPRSKSPTLRGSDRELTFRLESLTLGGALQNDRSLRKVYVSLSVLGAPFNTPDLDKGSPNRPITVNYSFQVPVEPSSRTESSLLSAMRASERDLAKANVILELMFPEGDTGRPLAVGQLNLRELYDANRELVSERVVLLDQETNEEVLLTISTNVLPTLERIMASGASSGSRASVGASGGGSPARATAVTATAARPAAAAATAARPAVASATAATATATAARPAAAAATAARPAVASATAATATATAARPAAAAATAARPAVASATAVAATATAARPAAAAATAARPAVASATAATATATAARPAAAVATAARPAVAVAARPATATAARPAAATATATVARATAAAPRSPDR
jgi:hypothetical protein